MNSLQSFLELSLIFMLLITLFVCLHLGRSLRALRRDRTDLDKMVLNLRQYSEDAQNGINQLHNSSDSVGRALSKMVEAGQVLKHDLIGLCERSEALASQLEGSVFQRRGSDISGDSPGRIRHKATAIGVAEGAGGFGKSAAERELLRALRQKQG
ncbi:DUF6468 domain-containing protein [Neokomagataea thailandica]|uniref:DUF6468 domain-containing protein n=1 Tax=Neokomagataea tanensis NBRC 106556 TaxID=1223519 RepID=A0ABQ0QG46_9PROT|nr:MULTISPECIES: DUF6468 domain-containing protein [Neokomagataea]GBR43606.1 hypothetical protein AA106556_0151 [Neokomagataea tanensis NBRC 106556]